MKTLSYKSAGVDIDAKSGTIPKIIELTRKTFSKNVLGDIGLFGGLYSIKDTILGMEEPVLVSSTDGVGTKLKIAFLMNKHDTVGIDIVSHCVNDILVHGAKPLFFMDYLAIGKLEQDIVIKILEGLTEGCRNSNCALIGGETAEMPGFYPNGEYDLAGFISGIVDKVKIIKGQQIRAGDILLGLASSGLHTNGFSLARKILFEIDGYKVSDRLECLGKTIGEELLTPHKSYAKVILPILDTKPVISGMIHITGGGFYDNISRILPADLSALIDKQSWAIPPIFQLLQKDGNISEEEMYRVFNMGIGMILVVSPNNADYVKNELINHGEAVFEIGKIISGKQQVLIIK